MKDTAVIHRWSIDSYWAAHVLFLHLCLSGSAYACVPDDRAWVIQGRVCALSDCLLFCSHMDLRILSKWAHLPYLALASSYINSPQQHRSTSMLTSLLWPSLGVQVNADNVQVLFILSNKLHSCVLAYVGGKMECTANNMHIWKCTVLCLQAAHWNRDQMNNQSSPCVISEPKQTWWPIKNYIRGLV